MVPSGNCNEELEAVVEVFGVDMLISLIWSPFDIPEPRSLTFSVFIPFAGGSVDDWIPCRLARSNLSFSICARFRPVNPVEVGTAGVIVTFRGAIGLSSSEAVSSSSEAVSDNTTEGCGSDAWFRVSSIMLSSSCSFCLYFLHTL